MQTAYQTVNAEKKTLIAYLDAQRDAVLAILDGLDETALRTVVVPSGWTPLGLVEHLGGAEAYWFQCVVGGIEPTMRWPEFVDPPGGSYRSVHPVAEVVDFYRDQCRLSNDVLVSSDLDASPRGAVDPGMADLATDVRTIALHMIEETARHAGHLDIARELIDGTTGLGPR